MAKPTKPTPSEFWPLLHRLAAELERDGEDKERQAAALVEQMSSMPIGVVNAHIANLELVSAAILEILSRAKTE